MKSYLAILFSVISLELLADCILPDGTKLNEGAEGQKSLFDKGKVFENQKIIDQDGLGTCYAVGTTTTLKTVIPGNPDLSYHHAALVDSSKGKKGSSYLRPAKNKLKTLVDGGYVCETFNSLKKRGGACLKSESILERENLSDPKLQSRMHQGLGKYFDAFNKLKLNNIGRDELKVEIESAINIIEVENESVKKHKEAGRFFCTDQYFPTSDGLQEVLVTIAILSLIDPCEARFKALKKMSGKGSVIKSDNISIIPTDDIKIKLQKMISSDPHMVANLSKYLESNSLEPDEELKILTGNKLNSLFEELFPRRTFKSCSKQEPTSDAHPLLLVDGNVAGADFLRKLKAQKLVDCVKATPFEHLKARADLTCPSPMKGLIIQAILPLAELGQKLDSTQVYEALTNKITKQARQLEDILTPGCSKNLISLDGLSCTEHSLCQAYSGAKKAGKGCYTLDKAKSIFSSLAVQGVNENRAVALGICTAFMNNYNGEVTKFCSENPSAKRHIITLTGYRCSSGKLEYELLNSWGKSCPENPASEDPDAYKPFECILDIDGKPSGRFWVKENDLVDNTFGISTIRKDDKK